MGLSTTILVLVQPMLFLYTFSTGVGASGEVFYFNSIKGNDTICMNEISKTVPCKTLDLAKEIMTMYKNNLSIQIESDSILNVVLEIHKGTTVTISGGEDDYPVIECFGNSGISIKGSANITLQNLVLLYCNVSDDPGIGAYALAIIDSKHVLIKTVTINNSTNTAIHMVNCNGTMKLWNVTLQGNGHGDLRDDSNKTYAAGIHIVQDSESVHYDIVDCHFTHNAAPHRTKGNNRALINTGYGGAMYVTFGGTSNGSSLTITRSSFSTNSGLRGAGLYVYFNDSADNNRVNIQGGCNFSCNYAVEWGGAVSVGFSDPTASNEVTVSDCTLDHNNANFGAGITIFSTISNNPRPKSKVLLTNCHLLSNHGILSSAIDIAPRDFDLDKSGFLPEITICNCTIENNYLGYQYHSSSLHSSPVYHINSGVVIITKFKVYFGGNMTFLKNRYSALVIVSATVECLPGANIIFDNNTGYDGGALGIYGFSQLTLNSDLFLMFRGNHALNHGGAIVYRSIDQHSLISGKNCFLQHKHLHNETITRTSRVVFDQNKAEVAGNSIYSESFSDCFYQCIRFHHFNHEPEYQYYHYSNITRCLGNFSILPNNDGQFVSSGRNFSFKSEFTRNVTVFPGEKVSLPFIVVDDFNQTVRPLMSINQRRLHDISISLTHKYSLNSTITPIGEVGATSEFTFTVVGMRQIYFYFNITLRQCPPGFYHDSKNTHGVCKCSEREKEFSEVIGCVSSSAKINFGLWVGYVPNDNASYQNLYFSPCDATICEKTSGSLGSSRINSNLLPSDPKELNSHVCADNREGILCGRCSKGLSTYYHSRKFQCSSSRMCHMGFFFYFLSEIAPMVIFFIVVITLDLSLTSGASVGFIFFTQYLDKLTVHINEQFTHLRTPYRMFYGLFNFEFFSIEYVSFCPWKGSQILDVLVLKYATIALALCLVILLVALLRNNYCVNMCYLRKHINASSSVVHGLSAFLVICYAQSSRITFYVLRYTSLSGFNGKTKNEDFSYYGGLPYLKERHLWYAIPAFVSLVFITVIPPLILILYPLTLQLLSLCHLSEHWAIMKLLRAISIHRFIPFIDCFQSCYKDNCRCFAGLYFVYRIIILGCFTSNSQRWIFHVNSEIALVAFLGIHCIVQPYKRRLHNILDSLIFVNLALINGIEILTEQLYNNTSLNSNNSSLIGIYIINSVQLVLLYLPMLALLGFGFLKAYRYIRKMYCKKNYFQPIPANDVLEYVREDQCRKDIKKHHQENSGNSHYGSVSAN